MFTKIENSDEDSNLGRDVHLSVHQSVLPGALGGHVTFAGFDLYEQF